MPAPLSSVGLCNVLALTIDEVDLGKHFVCPVPGVVVALREGVFGSGLWERASGRDKRGGRWGSVVGGERMKWWRSGRCGVR